MATAEQDKKSAYEWLKDPEVQDRPGMAMSICDPDGWRHDDGVTMETAITFDDFIERLAQSTVELKHE